MRGAAVALLLLAPAISARASTIALAAHHADYVLSLDAARHPSSDIIALHGTMSFDVADLCSAWATTQHLDLTLSDAGGRDTHMTTDYATVEAKDGSRFEFHTREATDDSVTERLDGTMRVSRAGVARVVLTSPEAVSYTLPPGTKLPMAHTAALLQAAAQGVRFLSAKLFDGTEKAGAEETFTTIAPHWGLSAASSRFPALAGLASGRAWIAFFPPGEDMPGFELGARYYANGVSDELTLDFGDFAADGRLAALSVRRPARC